MTSKNPESNKMTMICDLAFVFQICIRFGAIWEPGFHGMPCRLAISYLSTFCLSKTEQSTKKPLAELIYQRF